MTTKECQRAAAKRPMGANAESSKTEGVNSHRTVKLPNSQQQLGLAAGRPTASRVSYPTAGSAGAAQAVAGTDSSSCTCAHARARRAILVEVLVGR